MTDSKQTSENLKKLLVMIGGWALVAALWHLFNWFGADAWRALGIGGAAYFVSDLVRDTKS